MERFCDKCGTLVSGEGTFCPQCGAPMASAVNLSKPSDTSSMMGTVTPGVDAGLAPGQHPETDEYFSGSGETGATYNTVDAPMPSITRDTMGTVTPGAPTPTPQPAPQPTGYQYNANPAPAPAPVQSPNYAQMPNYPQTSNVNNSTTENMTVSQWVGTYILGNCLSIISLIFLLCWAFGDTPQPKKNYARAMLIIQVVLFGLSIITMICGIACTGSLMGADFWDEISY